jgi:hypothetical protein
MVAVEKITLAFAEITLVKDHVICVDYFSEEPLNVNKGIEIVQAVKKIGNDGSCVVIHNVGDKYIFSTEALRFMGSQLNEKNHNYLARAIVTVNPAGRIAANNFIKFHKPIVPTKLFTNLDAAIVWAGDFTA